MCSSTAARAHKDMDMDRLMVQATRTGLTETKLPAHRICHARTPARYHVMPHCSTAARLNPLLSYMPWRGHGCSESDGTTSSFAMSSAWLKRN
eukprot:4128249-Prymnesium_polylepis.1